MNFMYNWTSWLYLGAIHETLIKNFLEWYNFQDYELCVKRGDNECKYMEGGERDDFGQLTEFFCGQEDDCT